MKNWSIHFVFDQKFQWKKLEKVFPEIWEMLSKESKLNQEEQTYDNAALELNMREIRNDRKPQGYVRDGAKFRLAFPVDRKEMILYRGFPVENLKETGDVIAKMLKAKGIKFTLEFDKMLLQEIKSRKK
ncbi:MAG: hypothetical protein M1454_05875 [Candidatus Thermoplasmatota archaeon]|nr:hypothetical protein [Candidatus Thermoplasmatota archaeon]MCL5731375.1 hypothetical protein [Candidatus Thermoplasmatota archaeon]